MHTIKYTLRDDSFVVVRIDAHTVTLEVESILTKLCMSQLILVQVRPAPYPGIDHMGKTLTTSNLNKFECVCVCMTK